MSDYLVEEGNKLQLGVVDSFGRGVLSMEVIADSVEFSELCDGYFGVRMSHKEAIEVLETMVNFIKKVENNNE
jgi:hypothetical protein